MKKLKIAVIVVLTFISIFLLIRLFSFNIALRTSGFETEGITVYEHSYMIKDEFKIIGTRSKEKDVILVHLVKNPWGFWKIISSSENKNPETNVVSYTWVLNTGIKRYDFTKEYTTEKEIHTLYSGNNAIKLIEFKPGQIPENVTVNIQQTANQYAIHLISFASPKYLSKLDIPKILIDNECIGMN